MNKIIKDAMKLIEYYRNDDLDDKQIMDFLCDGKALEVEGYTDSDDNLIENAYRILADEYEYIISSDSCNGEEKEFLSFLQTNYPFLNPRIDLDLTGGLFINGNPSESSFWNEYCKSDIK